MSQLDEATASRATARAAAQTSLSVAAGVLGAVALSTVFLREFGASAQTDGFYAAFSVYLLVTLFGPALRVAGPAWAASVGDRDGERLLGAVLMGAAATGVALLAAAVPLATLLTSGAATPVAERTLLILAPCAAAQLVGSAQAASFQLAGRFGPPALAYTSSSVGAVITLIALQSSVGPDAMPIAFAVNSGLLCGVLWIAGARRADFTSALDSLRALLALATASSALAAVTAANVVATAFLAGERAGAQTIFSYAVFVGAVAYGLVGAPIATVLAARQRGDIAEILPVFRLATILTVPIVSATATGGAAVIGAVLSFNPADVGVLRRDVLLMAPWASMTTLLALATSTIVVTGHARRIAIVTTVTLGFHAIACVSLSRVIGSDGPVLASGLAPVLGAIVAVAAARPARPARFVREIASVTLAYGSLSVATAVGVWYAAGAPRTGDVTVNLATALAGCAAYTVAVLTVRRKDLAAVAGLRRS